MRLGTATPSTPMSASAAHTCVDPLAATARAGTARRLASGHAARTTSGGHSLASRSRTASRNASWSSVKAKRTACYFLGRPRTRSATMLRWISLVPA